MSKLASKITAAKPPVAGRTKRGPDNVCFPLYGQGDLEDWEALEAMRQSQRLEWKTVQEHIDGLLEIRKPLQLDKFKYHWRRFCSCWPDDLRRGR